MSGKVLLVNESNDNRIVNYGYLYHDSGFIDVASAYPALRGITVAGTQGSNILRTDHVFTKEDIGKYISLKLHTESGLLGSGTTIANNAVVDTQFIAKIDGVSDDGETITLDKNLPQTVAALVTIIFYNEIIITPCDLSDENFEITKLSFGFYPTFS